MDGPLQGWLKKAGQKGINFKKKYFRQHNSELHYYDNEKSEDSQGCINLLDCINLFPEGKAKQGIFILLTQNRAWKLQAMGDDPDAVRAQWMKKLELWLNENRPGFKKLKKMGFEKPTVVQSMPGLSKRASVSSDIQSSSSTPLERVSQSDLGTESSASSQADEDLKLEEYGVGNMKAAGLNYRRLELQIKIAENSISSGGNVELLKRVKELENEREEKRAAATLREFQLSELEKEYDNMANVSREDFKHLLKRVASFEKALLKPGFEKIQAVFESIQMGDEPELSRTEIFELLSHFDGILPPVETVLHMSTTLLQKDRADVLQRVTELESESKALDATIEELDGKKEQVVEATAHLKEMSTQIKNVAQVFPTVGFDKAGAVNWLKVSQDDGDELEAAITATKDAISGREQQTGNENLKLMRMEKIGQSNPNVVLAEDGSIKAATVDALFSLLINGEGRIKHPEFEDAILYGFPSFAEPIDLLEKVVLCFCSTLPPNFSGSRQRAEAIIEMNRKRLCSLVRKWLLYHEHHFRERSFSKFLQDFIVTIELSGLKEEASKLRDLVNSNIFPFNGESEDSILPPDLSNFTLLDLSPVEVARQMTRLDAALFEVIETRDFLEVAWTNKNPNVAKSVKAITKQFNRMSQWVASMILREEDHRRRGSLIDFFIQAADACLQMNNFNGLLQILGALGKTEIHRLTNSWDLVPKEKMKLIESHRELLQSNCSLLRQRYAAAKPPCLPYLGTYLTDLVMIGEQKTRMGDKINYRKLQLQQKGLSALIRRSEEGIKFPYREVKEIRIFIMDDTHLFKTDNDLMNRSLELEPRAAEGGTAKLAKPTKSGFNRSESRAKVTRKVGSTDRNTVQLGSPKGSHIGGSQTMRNSTMSAGMTGSPGGDSRTPMPNIHPKPIVPSSSPQPLDASNRPASANDLNVSNFRSMRSGLRASSPAGSIQALRSDSTASPMIGKRSSPGLSKSPGAGGLTDSTSPDSGLASPTGRAPIPMPRKAMPKSPQQERRNPVPSPGRGMGATPKKALPTPPQEDEEEEDSVDL